MLCAHGRAATIGQQVVILGYISVADTRFMNEKADEVPEVCWSPAMLKHHINHHEPKDTQVKYISIYPLFTVNVLWMMKL